MSNFKKFLFSIFCISILFLSCEKKNTLSTPDRKVIYLATWSNFMTPQILSDFELRTGIHVELSYFSSNEEMLAKLQAGAEGYDIIAPSDYMIKVMRELNLLHEIDLKKISNFKKIDPRVLKKSYDSKNQHSVPYSWGTTGLAVRKDLFSGSIKSWKELFTRKDLQGKFTLLDDAREVIGAALKAKGYSLNSKQSKELEEARSLLVQAKPGVKAFTSEPKIPLIQGEFAISQVYMSDALQANRSTQGKVDYFVPEEGSTLWIDNLAIPQNSKNVQEAHQFIDFLLETAQSAELTKNILSAPGNQEAIHLLPKDLQILPGLFPSKKILSHCEMIEDLGDALKLWDRIWTELKAMK